MVSGLLSGYARTATDNTSRQGISAISRRVMTLAQIYDSLLGIGLSHTIDLRLYLQELCTSLPGLQEERAHNVDLVCHAESILMPLDSVTALGMAVAELVTNSYGHAFPGQAGTITVTLARAVVAGRATLTVRDDGVGFVAKVETSRRGMGLVKRLMDQIDGTLDVQSKVGTLWTLAFPLPQPIDGFKRAA